MDASRIAELPALLRSMADDVTVLPDFTALPKLWSIEVGWDRDADTLKVSAHLVNDFRDDFEQIAAVNAWAAALGGHLLLGEEMCSAQGYWRPLTAVAVLPGGFLFETWTHLTYPVPAADLARWAEPATTAA
jgi:hypothetical protein